MVEEVSAWEDVINLPEVQRSFVMCLILPKGLWVHFPLKDLANYIRHSSSITQLNLIRVTNTKNMWMSNAAKEGEIANGTLG